MSPRRRVTALALALPLLAGMFAAGCSDVPDLGRGKMALKAGDPAAEADLLPLAQKGFPEAQVKLAQTYAKSDSPQILAQAAHWYRLAMDDDPSVAVPLAKVLLKLNDPRSVSEAEQLLLTAERDGDDLALAELIDLYTDHPERDVRGMAPALVEKAAGIDTPETEHAVIRWYRAHVAVARYEQELARRCATAKERLPDCYVDLARHARAAGDKRAVETLGAEALARFEDGWMPPDVLMRMGWTLVSDGQPGAPFPELAHRMLKPVVNVSTTAQVRFARLLIDYPNLEPAIAPEQFLRQALAQGDPEASLALGRLYMSETRPSADPAKAERYLLDAARTLPDAHFFLGRLYQSGMLGRAEPVRAAEHLLIAARSGYPRADLALAQLFSENRGVRVNLAYAYEFARLAKYNAVPESDQILAQIQPAMTAAEMNRANALLKQEFAWRSARAASAQTQTAAAPASTSVQPEQSR